MHEAGTRPDEAAVRLARFARGRHIGPAADSRDRSAAWVLGPDGRREANV